MKIIIVGTAYPYRGGLAAFNHRLAAQLQKEGHEVEIYTFTLQYPGFLFPGKTQYADGPAPDGLRIVRAINSCNPLNWLSAGRKIRAQKPDVVVFAYWMSFIAPCFGTIARCLGRKTRCVGLVHNMLPHEPNIMDKLFPGYFVGAMSSFTALSQAVVADIGKFDKKGKPKSWAPHPIYDHYGEQLAKDAARKALGLREDGKYALFFGFIRDYKGLDLLLKAFALMKDIDIELIVAGEFYGESQPYFDMIDDLGIGDRVHMFNDYIPDNQVNNYFCAADLVVQPYKSATQSGVTQIAFHFEKPMVVTNVGGLPEIVPDGKIGFVVEPDPEQISYAVRRFYNEERETEFVAALKEEKSKYSWARLTSAILGK